MPCYINGQVVGNDRALCATNPMADWVEEQPPIGTSYPGPSLQDPQKLSLMANGIGTSYPGPSLQDPQKLRPTLPTRNTQMSSIPKPSIFDRVTDTDDFGNPLDANFAGDTNFGLLRDRAVGKYSQDAYDGTGLFGTGTPQQQAPAPEPSFLDKLRKDYGTYGDAKKAFEGQFKSSYNGYYKGVETPWDELPPGAKLGYNLEKYAPATVAGAKWLGEQLPDSFMKSDFAKKRGEDILTDPYTKIPETALDVAVAGYLPTKGALLAASKLVTTVVGSAGTQLFLGYGGIKYASNQEAVDSFIDKYTGNLKDKVNTLTGNTPKEGTTTTPTGKDTTDVSQPTGKDKNNIFGAGTPSGPSVINAAKTGNISTGLLDKMGTKDFWMTGIEGGSGKWDNRLFRLGEMMSYMGTPLSKRGDSPAKRWTSANTEASKLKQAISKASGVANSKLTKAEQVEKWKLISASEVPESVLDDLFYNKGIFESDADAKKNAAGVIGIYKSVRSKLLEAGRIPTHQDVLAEMKRLRGAKV